MLAGLTENEWEVLADYFHSEDIPETAMDLFELHGFVTALAIQPVPTPTPEWVAQVMGEEGQAAPAAIAQLLQKMLAGLGEEFESGNGIELPMELLPDDEEEAELLQSWCLGFIEGQMQDEEAWFGDDAEEVATLSLPMAAISGAMEEEDLGPLMATAEQRLRLAEQIPDSLVELYLYFREQAE